MGRPKESHADRLCGAADIVLEILLSEGGAPSPLELTAPGSLDPDAAALAPPTQAEIEEALEFLHRLGFLELKDQGDHPSPAPE